jgi:hypothetical protein
MRKPIKGTLIGAAVGAAYGLFNASQQYPSEWWSLLEGQVRIGTYVLVFVIVAAVIGFGVGTMRRNSN